MAKTTKDSSLNVIEKTMELGGRTLKLSTGKLAGQATMAVFAQYGETALLATVVASPMKMELDYFPLSVEYQERLYAGGRIKGSRWVKREGRPSDEEILTGRLIDRSIRPLFPKDYQMDVQVIVQVMSVDLENEPSMLAPIAVSAALTASSIPFMGPVSVLKVGQKDGKFSINPTVSELENSDLDLVVSTTEKAIVMIEAGANQVSDATVLDGIEFAEKEGKKVLKFISDFAKEVGNEKEVVEKKVVDKDLEKKVKDLVDEKLDAILAKKQAEGNQSRGEIEELNAAMSEHFEGADLKQAIALIDKMFKDKIRTSILKGKRPDGRKPEEIRNIWSEVGVLPRTHGSAVFTRGMTQALTITTLGAPSLGLLIESAEGEEEKHYIHHYSMPPYSTGETGRFGAPSRREIGHGALAERALQPVIPSESEFPYTIQVVSEVLSSNGSTSMASTCGSTLSLMDAGVPIKAPVAGIAMGLVIEDEKNFTVLSDIAGIEDFNGDMDFKVAGTEAGITAMQLDVKTLNLTLAILRQAMEQANKGRAHILATMLKTIDKPRETVNAFAPKIITITIDPIKIGEIIGPGGKTIKKIIAETGAQVDIDDSGLVHISAVSSDAVAKARETIENMVKEVQAGEIYTGKVTRIENYGAFVEILPGKTGLVHVSDMSEEYVSDPASVVSMDQEVQVRVKEVDNMGRINLSMLLDPAKDKEKEEQGGGRQGGNDRRGGGGRGFGGPRRDGGSRGGDRRGGRNFGGPRRGSGSRSSGPHFPTSRLISQDNSRSGNKFGR